MFENLKKYTAILVSGPQRSGTRICAKIIAQDTGHKYVDENNIKVDNLDMLKDILNTRENVVVQCPAVSAYLEEFSANDVLIIFMRRDVNDIIASQNRIGWGVGNERGEFNKYKDKFGATQAPVSKVKYKYWEKEQRDKIKNWKEIEYESLSKHELWIPKEKRTEFASSQTTIN